MVHFRDGAPLFLKYISANKKRSQMLKHQTKIAKEAIIEIKRQMSYILNPKLKKIEEKHQAKIQGATFLKDSLGEKNLEASEKAGKEKLIDEEIEKVKAEFEAELEAALGGKLIVPERAFRVLKTLKGLERRHELRIEAAFKNKDDFF
jgi:hypothetical protein